MLFIEEGGAVAYPYHSHFITCLTPIVIALHDETLDEYLEWSISELPSE